MQVENPVAAVVVGAGWAGRRQLAAAGELDGAVRFVGLVDPDAEQARAVAAEFAVPTVYPDLTDALSDDSIDAVSICAPHDLHRPITVQAARAGKHVLCEKPIALSVTDATAMIDETERNGVVLHVNEQDAYEPVVDDLRHVLNGEQLGDVVSASLAWGFSAVDFAYAGRRRWLTDPNQGGTGTWMLHGVHKVAQLRAILGEVRGVAAVAYTTPQYRRRDLAGSVHALLTMEAGCPVDVLVTSESPVPEQWRWTIFGTAAVVVATPSGITRWTADSASAQPLSESNRSSYAHVLADFASSVRDGQRGRTDGRSERRSLAVIEAAEQAAAGGGTIDLLEAFGPL